MAVLHPAARMVRSRQDICCNVLHANDRTHSLQLVELSAAQDIEAGDGTTSVVVLAGSLLAAAEKILSMGKPNHCQLKRRLTEPILLRSRHSSHNYRTVIPEGRCQGCRVPDGAVDPRGSE